MNQHELQNTSPADPLLQSRLSFLASAPMIGKLTQGLRGVEREALRVDMNGHLNLTPHPPVLGAALTHPNITTDYSESLIELITQTSHDAKEVLDQLRQVHAFVAGHLPDQLIWSQSMPCILPPEVDIPIAQYGSSHIGRLKHVYRKGLALRYGKTMQCIAGIHYNFSLAESVWGDLYQAKLRDDLPLGLSAQDVQSESYIALIRNYLRYNWLLMYLFGASPAVAKGFVAGKPDHFLQTLSEDTLYLPYATSLRMSGLGYQNNAQDGLVPPYNDLMSYMRNLSLAVRKPYEPYEQLGVFKDGQWQQINGNILQIENEFYATIRPKRVIRSGERPVEALCDRGVQYVEIRCMDVDPFDPIGLSLGTSRFLDVFITYCALAESGLTDVEKQHENDQNFTDVVTRGREPQLKLSRNGEPVAMVAWANQLLDEMESVAVLLDQASGGREHQESIAAQRLKVQNPDLTPSAQVLSGIRQHHDSFIEFSLALSAQNMAKLQAVELDSELQNQMQDLVKASLIEQSELEREQQAQGDFDQYIRDYGSRTNSRVCGD